MPIDKDTQMILDAFKNPKPAPQPKAPAIRPEDQMILDAFKAPKVEDQEQFQQPVAQIQPTAAPAPAQPAFREGLRLQDITPKFTTVEEDESVWEKLKSFIPKSLPDFITGADRETAQTKNLPETIGANAPGGFWKNVQVTAGLLLTANEDEQKRIINNLVPGTTFYKDQKGNSIVEYPNGNLSVLNKPGLSIQDLLQTATTAVLFAPAAITSNASKIAAKVPKNITDALGTGRLAQAAPAIATGMATGAGTEALIQGAQRGLGGEFNPGDIALAGATGGLVESVAPIRAGIAEKANLKKFMAEKATFDDVSKAVRMAERATEETKIPLFKAQKTAVPAELDIQSFLGTLPEGAQLSVKRLREQNKAASEAVDSFLNKVADYTASETGAKRLRTAAEKAIENQKAIRAEKASPLYKEAFEDASPVELANVKELIADIADKYPTSGGEVSKTMQKVENLLAGELVPAKKKGNPPVVVPPSMRKLHGAKLEIDQMLAKFGDNALGNTTKRELAQVQAALLEAMDEANPAYKKARKVFAENTPAVEGLKDSIIGKIAGVDDITLDNLSTKVFSASNNVDTVRNAKKVLTAVDPAAWDAITRMELERRLGSLPAGLKEGELVANSPARLHKAIFGNEKQKAFMRVALNDEAWKNYVFLETALKRASLGRPGGSQTAGREEIKKKLRGGIASTLREFIGNPLKGTAALGEDLTFSRRARALAEVMYDPAWKLEMAKLRKLDPKTPAAAKLFSQVLQKAVLSDKEDDKNTEKEGAK